MPINGLMGKDNANIHHTLLEASWVRNTISPCLPLSIPLIHPEGLAACQSIAWPPLCLLPSSHYLFVLTPLYTFLLVCVTYHWHKYLFMSLSAPQECELLRNKYYSLLILSSQLLPLTLAIPCSISIWWMSPDSVWIPMVMKHAVLQSNHLILTVSYVKFK